MMNDLEVGKYLNRIGISDCTASLAGLSHLQGRHMESVPFENLDIVVGRKIGLGYEHLFDKVVVKRRGGYCFELNILYAELLKSLAFSPQPVLGRVWLSNPKGTPPRNHLAHLVVIEGKTYVTDVGFGGLITRVPLDINVSAPVNDKDGVVRVVKITDRQFMIQRHSDKGWSNQYSFEDVKISSEDISIANYYMSTHPDSHFYHHKFIGRNTKEGRIGLFNNKMSIRKGIKVVSKKRVDFGDDWLEIVRSEFEVNLDFSDQELDTMFERQFDT